MSAIHKVRRAVVVTGLVVGCVAGIGGAAYASDHDGEDGARGEARARCDFNWFGFTPHQCKANGGATSDDSGEY